MDLHIHLSTNKKIVFIHSLKTLSKYHIQLYIHLKICQNIVFTYFIHLEKCYNIVFIYSFSKKFAKISYSFIHLFESLPQYRIHLFIHL